MRAHCVRLLMLATVAIAQSALACIELNGEVRQGALLWGAVNPDSKVYLDDEALRVSTDGIVVFGLGRDSTGTLTLRVEGLESCVLSLQIATREYRIQRVDGV